MRIALIMLAAGNSRRFGSNKLLYEIDGKPMYQHILDKLLAVAQKLEEKESGSLEDHKRQNEESDRRSAGTACTKIKGTELIVVTQYDEIEQEAGLSGVRVYMNPHPDEGISSSLKIGLKANLDADACLFSVSDQPWLTADTIEKLIELLQTSGKGIACVSCQGKLGNPCIFTKKYYEELLAVTGDKGGKSVIRAHKDDTAVLDVGNAKELTDVDRKIDFTN